MTMVAVVVAVAASWVARRDVPTLPAGRPQAQVATRVVTPGPTRADAVIDGVERKVAGRRQPASAPRRGGPEVRVDAREVVAFWRLVDEVRAEGVIVPAARWRVDEATGELPPLPEIAAIHVPALSIEPLAGAGSTSRDVGGVND
jgi:hypothetical protein